MRLNEYPKEELKSLLDDLEFCIHHTKPHGLSKTTEKWHDRISEAIRDREFKEKELPFNKTPPTGSHTRFDIE